jgi:hypothetical protein
MGVYFSVDREIVYRGDDFFPPESDPYPEEKEKDRGEMPESG